IYVVSSGGQTPRFAYTVGVSESIGAELLLAGAIFYMADDVVRILNEIAVQKKTERDRELFGVAGIGSFTLREAHSSWASELLLGAFDYYQRRDIRALQIVPDKAHWTIDVPDVSTPWSAQKEPVWQWLRDPWKYSVPETAKVTTNLSALR